MGQCQSHSGILENTETQYDTGTNAPSKNGLSRVTYGQLKSSIDRSKAKTNKLTIVTSSGDDTGAQVPSTGRTAAETPEAIVQPSCLDDSSEGSESSANDDVADEEYEYHDLVPNSRESRSLVNFFPSLRYTQGLDPIIPEEVDPDAPSDEEDERLQEQARSRQPSAPGRAPSKDGLSPSRPQSIIKSKMRHQTATKPSSIIHHHETQAALPPSPSSVNPSTISQFRKLKVQVKLAKRRERKRQRAAKLEDRLQDVKSHYELWENFEEIQGHVDTEPPPSPTSAPPKLKRSNSFDLQSTDTWFFDFQSFDEDDNGYCDDDAMSQSSLSLHSTTSMESQRRYFQEKREQRRSRRRGMSEPNLLLTGFITNIPHQAKPTVHQKTMEEASPNHQRSPTRRLKQMLSTPPRIFPREDQAETPSELGTPCTFVDENEGRGRVAPTLNAFEIATGEPEYHVYRDNNESTPLEQDDDTPKAKSRKIQTRPASESRELDMNNDYQVARRKRIASFDKAGIRLFEDEKQETESLGIRLPPTLARDNVYSSSAISIFATDHPEVQVMRMSPTDATKNANRREKVVSGNAARSLEEVSHMTNNSPKDSSEKKSARKRYEGSPPVNSSIALMSKEDFLGFSDAHALVRVSHRFGHDIDIGLETPTEHSPSRSHNREGSCATSSPMADQVSKQIDDLLEKYRSDNETTLPHDFTEADVATTSSRQVDFDPSTTNGSLPLDHWSRQIHDLLEAYRNESEDDDDDMVGKSSADGSGTNDSSIPAGPHPGASSSIDPPLKPKRNEP